MRQPEARDEGLGSSRSYYTEVGSPGENKTDGPRGTE